MRSLMMLSLLLVCIASPFPLAHADDPPAENQSSRENDLEAVSPVTTETEPAAESIEQQQELKKRKLEIGLILTSGIIVIGVFLVVLILLYGRRTRRQLSAGRGPSALRDELWYLKQARETSSTDVSDAEREGESE